MEANKIIARALRVIDAIDREDAAWNQAHSFQHRDRIPLIIMSHPGYGKTSTIRKWCEYMDYNLYTIIPSQNASDDILGLNTKSGDRMVRLTPSWYNNMMEMINLNNKRTVLFIDEISTCDSYIQGPLLNLIFNRSLGEVCLPDNVMVVAAGNYAEDLHNAFEMNEALVNRHMILNLYRKDFSIAEQIQGTFHKISDKKEIEAYFGLKEETPMYDIVKFKEWMISTKDVDYSKESRYTSDPEYGLRGYTSPRSLDFTLRFIEKYVSMYADRYWMRIAGDTLGSSDRHDGKPLRLIFESAAEDYFKIQTRKLSDNETLGSVCEDIKKSAQANKGVPTQESIQKLQDLVTRDLAKNFNSADLSNFAYIVTTYSKDFPVLKEIAQQLANMVRSRTNSKNNY